MRARLRPGVALALVAAAVMAGIASASTSVTITSPASNSKVSLKRTPYVAIAGGASFAATTAGTTRFYLRRDGCGTANDNPHLSVTSGTDAGDGCGLILNGVTGLGGDVDQSAFVDFPASDGTPLSLDGTKAVQGQVALTGAQVGLAEVDVTLAALVGGQPVTIGTATGSAVLDPTGNDTPVPFTIQPNTSLDGADVQALDLRVRIHGPNVYSGFVSLDGNSWLDMPSHAASVNQSVSVSIDDPTFANAVPARIDGSTWSVAVPTPEAGKHTIYARSTQGFDTSPVASSTFKVTR
ncbi:MAG: hypothetical protein ACRDL2_12430 [Gaiellaceae bacterium]